MRKVGRPFCCRCDYPEKDEERQHQKEKRKKKKHHHFLLFLLHTKVQVWEVKEDHLIQKSELKTNKKLNNKEQYAPFYQVVRICYPSAPALTLPPSIHPSIFSGDLTGHNFIHTHRRDTITAGSCQVASSLERCWTSKSVNHITWV